MDLVGTLKTILWVVPTHPFSFTKKFKVQNSGQAIFIDYHMIVPEGSYIAFPFLSRGTVLLKTMTLQVENNFLSNGKVFQHIKST